MKKIILISILVVVSLSCFLALKNYSKTYSEKNFSVVKKDIFQETVNFDAVSFITPHHLLAKDLMENIFREFSKANENKQPERIILLSPNHFNVARAPIVIPDISDKETNAAIDEAGVKKLLEYDSLFEKGDNSLEKDHGIFNILPFSSRYFPKAKVIPLMIRDDISLDKINEISEILSQNFSEKTIVILSADFSHYIAEAMSGMHDKKAISAISNFDFDHLNNLDIDCRGGLRILLGFSEKNGFSSFRLVENSNSSKIVGRDLGEENTSYITGYFSREKEEEKKILPTVNILFMGDLMLDRQNRIILSEKGVAWPTEKIERLFWSQDINLANLEAPITSNESVSLFSSQNEGRHFMFTTDPEQTKIFLRNNNINLVSLGNNHINNFGSLGISQTKKSLDEFGVGYFGDPEKENDSLIKDINGQRIAFLSYNQFAGPDFTKIGENIAKIKKEVDVVVIYCHWGAEYQLKENENQRKLAHYFVDQGADLVIGSHPHVVQPVEVYKNKAIFYSLGNFFFDQYFSEEVRNILTLGVVISKEKVTFYPVSLRLEKGGQLVFQEGKEKEKFFRQFLEFSRIDNSLKDDIIRNNKFELNY